jgi:hypothetical protein
MDAIEFGQADEQMSRASSRVAEVLDSENLSPSLSISLLIAILPRIMFDAGASETDYETWVGQVVEGLAVYGARHYGNPTLCADLLSAVFKNSHEPRRTTS